MAKTEKEISGLFTRQYVIQKGGKKGTGSTPYCHFHPRKPSTQIAQGTVTLMVRGHLEGLPFYEPVCDACCNLLKQGVWPEGVQYQKREEVEADVATESVTPASQEAAVQQSQSSTEVDMRKSGANTKSKSSPKKGDKKPVFSIHGWFESKAKKGTTREKLLADVKAEGVMKHTNVADAETLVKRHVPWLRSIGAKVDDKGHITLK